jgi:hypothetical protein
VDEEESASTPGSGPGQTPRLWIFSQFVWPDDAPTGIYAEQLADAVTRAGTPATLVAGCGDYRPGKREPPLSPIERVSHRIGGRHSLLRIAAEYRDVHRAFEAFLTARVGRGDVVVVTTAPPLTLRMHRAIRAVGAIGVYWLQDFYPELVRGIAPLPSPILGLLRRYWRRELARWPLVIKAAGNLGYHGNNAQIIRNWPTVDLGAHLPSLPRTALYSGNLSYAHDLVSFLELCSELHAEGYEVTVRGDGKWISQLPVWIRIEQPVSSLAELARSYWQAEVHLVAGHPRISTAVFPSKYWNSRATGRKILCSGFAGPMLEELGAADAADYTTHLRDFRDLLLRLAKTPTDR